MLAIAAVTLVWFVGAMIILIALVLERRKAAAKAEAARVASLDLLDSQAFIELDNAIVDILKATEELYAEESIQTMYGPPDIQ